MELYQKDYEDRFQANTLAYSIEIYAWSIAFGIKAKEYSIIQNQKYQPNDFSGGYEKLGNAELTLHYMHELQNAGVHATAPDTFN